MRQVIALVVLAVVGPHFSAAVIAQEMTSVAPIQCWWQSSTGAVTIGEAFDVTLTCAVLDTEAVQVVPDESRLGVASSQVAPFEILGGSHPPDVRRGPRRFFQYDYQLRIIGPDAVGQEIHPAMAKTDKKES